MYCTECGSSLPENAKFCPQCGKQQDGSIPKDAPVMQPIKNLTIEEKARLYDMELALENKTEHPNSNTSRKFDSARIEKEAMYFGLILTGVWLCFVLLVKSGRINFTNSQRGFAIASTLIRILVILWIRGIAARLDRNKSFWSIFAFFFPGLALIIIGNLTSRKK